MRSLIIHLAADWRLTKKRHSDRIKLLRNYQYFRTRGFTMRSAWFNAANVL